MFKSDDNNCLVLVLNSPELIERHHHIRTTHGGTHDYESYIPHVTISYNVNDFDHHALPLPDFDLMVVEEQSHPLKLDWKIRAYRPPNVDYLLELKNAH
jgi:hypothetical protein